MFTIPVYYLIFPHGERKLCFSKAHYVRVLQYQGWTRDEARQAIELSADVHTHRWSRASPKRDQALKVLTVSTTIGKATLQKVKNFWKSNTTDLGTLEPQLPVLLQLEPYHPWRTL